MLRRLVTLPGLSSVAIAALARHYLVVFIVAFLGAVSAGLIDVASVPTLEALLWSAAAAGVSAVLNAVLGIIPAADLTGLTLSPAAQSQIYSVALSIATTFLAIFGAGLVAGVVGVTSLPSLVDIVTAAISAGVAGVIQLATNILPAPKVVAK